MVDTAVLSRAGVAAPTGGNTLATFLGDLRTLKAAGATPLCVGGRDPFTTVELFENVLLGTVGANG